MSKKQWIFLVLLYCITRIPVWFYPPDSDHWIFYLIGKWWFGGSELYTHIWDHKPPAIFFFNGFMSLVSDSIIIHRSILTVVSLLSVYLMYRFVLKMQQLYTIHNTHFVFITLSLFIALINTSFIANSGNNTESWALPFILGIYHVAISHRRLSTQAVLIGFLTSVIILLKPQFLLLLFPALLISYKKNREKLIPLCLVTLLSTLVFLTLWLSHFYFASTLKELWIAAYEYSSHYAKIAWRGGVSNAKNFIIQSTLILLPVCISAILLWKKRTVPLIRFALLSCSIGIFVWFLPGTFYPYYLLVATPFFAVTISLAYSEIEKKRFQNIIVAVGLILFLIIQVLSYRQLYNTIAGPVAEDYRNLQKVAEYIARNVTKDQDVQFFGYGNTLYSLITQRPVSRLQSASFLLIDSKYTLGYNYVSEWLDDNTDTEYLVLSPEYETLYKQIKDIDSFIRTHYIVQQQFGDYRILQRK